MTALPFRRRLPAGLPALAAAGLVLLAGAAPALAGLSRMLDDRPAAWEAVADPVLWERLGSRLLLSLGVMAAALPLGIAQAWLLVRSDLPLRGLLFALVPLPLFLPPLLHVLTWFGTTRMSGIPAVILVETVMAAPLVVLGAARSFESISRNRAEAARLAGGVPAVIRQDLRQGLPGAFVGAALAFCLQINDFTLADFLSAVGPKITTYGDSLYAHHLGLRPAATAGAALPGLLITGLLILWALRRRRALGAAVDSSFAPAEPISLNGFRIPALTLMGTGIALGALFPYASLAWQAGSLQAVLQQAASVAPRIGFTLAIAGLAALFATLLAWPLALAGARLRGGWILDVLVPLPFAIPALVHATGLIRIFNRPGLEVLYLGPGLLVLALATRYLVFTWLPVGGAAERIDRNLMDMPRLAGASGFATAARIQFPLLRRSLVSAACVAFAFSLREIDSLIVLRAGQDTLLHAVYSNVIFARQEVLASLSLVLALITGLPLLLHQLLLGRAMRFL